MSALTILLPGNSSRTRTQAIIVPMTALITTTISEAIRVSFSDATACSPVTAVQKVSQPSSSERDHDRRQRDQHDQAQVRDDDPAREPGPPRADRAVPPRRACGPAPPPRSDGGAVAGRESPESSLGGDSQVALDLGDRAARGIEELGGDRGPAAEVLDREQARGIRELVLVVGEDFSSTGR